VIKREEENVLDLRMETQHMWNVTTNVLPVITGQLEPSQNYLENT
jgi:hypothetical protein